MDFDLVKARPHKYVKRTGTPGHYKYWYKLADGTLSTLDDEAQKAGRKEHLQRLIAARLHGHHTMDREAMLNESGIHKDAAGADDRAKRTKARQNLRGYEDAFFKLGKRKLIAEGLNPEIYSREAILKRGHDFAEHHMKEGSHGDVNHSGYVDAIGDDHVAVERVVNRTARRGTRAATPAPATPVRTAVEATQAEAEGVGQRANERELETLRTELSGMGINLDSPAEAAPTPSPNFQRDLERVREAADRASTTRNKRRTRATPPPTEAAAENPEMTSLRGRLDEVFTDRDARRVEDREVDSAIAAQAAPEATPAETPEQMVARLTQENERLRAKLAAQTRTPAAPVAEQPTPVTTTAEQKQALRAAAQRAKALARAIGPDAPAAREMAATDPTFAADEAPIREAIARQASGKNPYLERAKEIFERVAPHIKPQNRLSFQHFLNCMDEAVGGRPWAVGDAMDESRVKALYVSGKTDEMLDWSSKTVGGRKVQGLKDVMTTYQGLYHDIKEILGNAPINPEVERMKRGFARKQFERMRPYIKDQWHLANPNAPAPYPTFDDCKSWNEFGGRPSWVSPQARMAIPKEVFDAAPKDANGKVQLPPGWMPIHLSPLWNFACQKQSDYSARPSSNEVNGSGINLDPSRDLRSHIMNALRKYVQARGGAEQLIDIPSSKLPRGISHADIFKSFAEGDLSEATMRRVLSNKIIDPVAMAPFVEAELQPKEVKKSWVLVTDLRMPPPPKVEEALVKSETERAEELRKSQLIHAIKVKRDKLAKAIVRG